MKPITTLATRLATAAVVAAALPAAAVAQDLVRTAPPQTRPVVIENATIHTVSGDVIENGSVVFEDGVITQVLPEGRRASVRRADDPLRIDATGKHVYPGFISAVTALGLVEINAVRATVDTSEVGDVKPEVRAAVSVNPDSTLIPVARSNGVLTAGVFPAGGAIRGRASVMRMDGWTWEDMTVLDDAGLIVNWPNMRIINAPWMNLSESEQRERSNDQIRTIKDSFDAAQAYIEAQDADPATPTDIRFEAMRPALSGDTPVFILAQEYEQIQASVSWAIDQGLKPVIIGGRDALLAIDILREHDIPVVLTGVHRLPSRRDAPYDEPFRLPSELEAASLRWCLATGGGTFGAANERNLPYHAATAVAFGLPHDAALRAITLSVAEILNVSDTLGCIERGKAATLVISDGHPLELSSNVEMAFIDGRRIDISNKQTELRDKYREKYRQLGLDN